MARAVQVATAQVDQGGNDQAPCRVCKKPIPNGAKKCTECDSFLDWRRFLVVGQTTLALLVALISVLSTTMPSFYAWISPAYSDLHAEVRQVFLEKLELFVSNNGNRNGRLVGAALRVTTRSGAVIPPLALEVGHDGQIPQKSSVVVHVAVHPEKTIEFLSWPYGEIDNCFLDVRMAEYRAEPRTVAIACPRDILTLFCKATEGAARQFGRLPPNYQSHCR